MKRMKTASSVILGALGTIALAGMMCAFGAPNSFEVYGTVDFQEKNNLYADCPTGATCYIQYKSNGIDVWDGNYKNDIVIHCDNGDDIEVEFYGSSRVLTDGEHAILTLVPKGDKGRYLLLKAHPIK